jgi:hypothetical protein
MRLTWSYEYFVEGGWNFVGVEEGVLHGETLADSRDDLSSGNVLFILC